MCGIAGIVDLVGTRPIDPRLLHAMTDALRHRGPDGEGHHIEPGLGFGHRRLSIIDLEGGTQPFRVTAAGQMSGTRLTYNGELYNYRPLRKRLERNGRVFRTQSDTEVLCHLLDEEGIEALDQTIGMFAFAAWEERTETLHLVRDRLGEKPLYYTVTPDGWCLFASEINGILASGMIRPTIDQEALGQYLTFGYVPDPLSIYREIKKLPAGHRLTLKRGQEDHPPPQAWWSCTFDPDPAISAEIATEELTGLIDRVVSDQLISDVPVSAFLSGGVDSGMIVSAMASVLPDPVRTTTIGFNEASYDERDLARLVATRYATDHQEKMVQSDHVRLIETIAAIYGEPFADTSALPTLLVCQAARTRGKVALSGDGGDEVFAGYDRYGGVLREAALRGRIPGFLRSTMGAVGDNYPRRDNWPAPFRLKTALQAVGMDQTTGYGQAVAAVKPDIVASILNETALTHFAPMEPILNAAATTPPYDPVTEGQAIDLATWLPGRMLVKVDRASMARGLEVRPPLLDHRLVEWAARLPVTLKWHKGKGKRILRNAMQDRLPAEVLEGKKRGFGAPVDSWFRRPDSPLAQKLDQSTAWRDSGYFDVNAVERLMKRHRRRQINGGQALWSIMMFDAFLTQDPAARDNIPKPVSA